MTFKQLCLCAHDAHWATTIKQLFVLMTCTNINKLNRLLEGFIALKENKPTFKDSMQ